MMLKIRKQISFIAKGLPELVIVVLLWAQSELPKTDFIRRNNKTKFTKP